ncbi:YpdA family putative bacillithiol disulfide reductase [Ornithinibacillus salinisoli]|uniref:YpdA family putative bacillithiol disulfide reductase n=1 Tax=Ornithinibacillus salinisoli TaxID=1848459 RepID=A0ABW4W445_9BACI
MQREKVIIVGAGPCGMSCAIELQKYGIDPLIIEKQNIVNTVHNFPTHQTFFSSSEKLEIGEIPFITEKQKPTRNQALAYYRSVADRKQLRINSFEKVLGVKKSGHLFEITSELPHHEKKQYSADHVIIATGYYDQPNTIEVPGEGLNKVMHYFKEAHPYFKKDIVIIGGKNSAIDAALELNKAGANITVLYRGENYSTSIKPWILPDFESLVKKEVIQMEFNAQVEKITEDYVYYKVNDERKKINNDFVFAMTGYKPDVTFLKSIGVTIDPENGKPYYNEDTFETNVSELYIAGVIAAGYNNNKIFIENGRFHAHHIAKAIAK